MKLALDALRRVCDGKGITLTELLKRSGVSRNALYSLARKDTTLPESIVKIARELGVRPSKFLREGPPIEEDARELLAEVDRIMAQHPSVARDDVRHTLLLMREQPIDRLRRALRRGRRTDIQRRGS
ncbi:helix-turn-helix domain-containing protein [Verrucomicrobiota bacterium]